LTSGQATVADSRQFIEWRQRSLVHAEAFHQTLKLQEKLRIAAQELRSAEPQNVLHVPFKASARVSRRLVLGGGIAASAAGLVLWGMPSGLLPTIAELSAQYRTATGEQRSVAFAPGLAFELNTQTSLSVENKRAVELVSGEVAVQATLSAKETLNITALNGEIRAADAVFNVRNTDGVVCATCLSGHVTVVQGQRFASLVAGEQVSYSKNSWVGKNRADIETATAWRSGILIFHDLPLSQVLDEANRYRPGRILLMDSMLGKRKFNGVLQLRRPDAVLGQLRSLGVQVITLPGGLALVS